MQVKIVLSREEVNNHIPYPMICETRYGKTWKSTKVQERFRREFTEYERKAAFKIFGRSHIWYLRKGVPDEVELTIFEYDLWKKLAAFCASI